MKSDKVDEFLFDKSEDTLYKKLLVVNKDKNDSLE
jgi:hypothetical protein